MQQWGKQLIKIALIGRFNTISSSRCCNYYYTKANKKKTRPSLYATISPLGDPNTSVSPVLDHWVQSRNKEASFAELQRIIRDLRKRRRFSQALEVSEWARRKDMYKFTPTEHAVHLDLMGRVHGFASAETYFNNLSEQEKTERTYGALLHCYVRQNQIQKSLSHLQKMKDNGITISTMAFNDIMCLYTKTDQIEKVPLVLSDMKECQINPDNFSYRLCINSYGLRADIEEMEKLLEEMERQPGIIVDWNTYAVVANYYIKADMTLKANNALRKAEERLDKKDSLGYNQLISLHARLGNRTDVVRIWDLEKRDCNRCINRDYINMLESLVRLGELQEAEQLLSEWESCGNTYDFRVPNVVILGYVEKGLYEKAKVMLEMAMREGKTVMPNSWARVVEGYLNSGETKEAVACMKAALSLRKEGKRWKFPPNLVTRLLYSARENDSSEDFKCFVDLMRNAVSHKVFDEAYGDESTDAMDKI